MRQRRDQLQEQLNACHEAGSGWIEKVIRSFELIELLQEAIFLGSARSRELVLHGLVSNYSVEGKKLIWKGRAPFQQAEQKGVVFNGASCRIRTHDLLVRSQALYPAELRRQK